MGRLYAESPYQFGGSQQYYARLRYNTNSDSRWYLSVYPETPKEIAVDYATSAGSASYSRNLLGRNTSGSDYGATDGNLEFAEWNTHGDNRWYLKSEGYETRVGYANSAGSASASDVYAWAKASTKPTYTASEVGALSTAGGTLTNSLTLSAGNITVSAGSVSAKNGFFETSDERLKDIQAPLTTDLEKLSHLRKVYFNFKEDPSKTHIGVIAQDIKELYPEIVNETDEGTLNVDYSKLSVIVLDAIDTLHKEKVEIKKENEEIKKRLEKLESLLLNQ